jgi:hypothetical protein
MTHYSLSRRIKLSHLLLLFCVDHIAFILGINRLAECKRSASNLLHKPFYQANISLRRDSLAERLTLTSSGLGDGSLAPILGEPREQSKKFKLEADTGAFLSNGWRLWDNPNGSIASQSSPLSRRQTVTSRAAIRID